MLNLRASVLVWPLNQEMLSIFPSPTALSVLKYMEPYRYLYLDMRLTAIQLVYGYSITEATYTHIVYPKSSSCIRTNTHTELYKVIQPIYWKAVYVIPVEASEQQVSSILVQLLFRFGKRLAEKKWREEEIWHLLLACAVFKERRRLLSST